MFIAQKQISFFQLFSEKYPQSWHPQLDFRKKLSVVMMLKSSSKSLWNEELSVQPLFLVKCFRCTHWGRLQGQNWEPGFSRHALRKQVQYKSSVCIRAFFLGSIKSCQIKSMGYFFFKKPKKSDFFFPFFSLTPYSLCLCNTFF